MHNYEIGPVTDPAENVCYCAGDRASIQPSAQDSTYGMLKQLCYRHIFLTPLLLFKALYSLAPAYLSDIISFKGDSN